MLSLAEGCGETPIAALLDPDADAERILRDPPALPRRVLAAIRSPDLEDRARRLLSSCEAAGIAVLTPESEEFPALLRRAPLRPLCLFARGNLEALRGSPSVAVVGSRTPTPYGRQSASSFTAALARTGVPVWSGLARGIDALAHGACLEAGAPTVAVLAGGLDRVYPAEHEALARRIEANGCLLSEAPLGRRPRRGHFPRRNRLVAWGTDATLVVEAGLLSGALHTARFAAEVGSPVFAVPGPWTSERSRGCHRLIAEGALIAEDPAELLRNLGLGARRPPPNPLALQLSAGEQALLAAVEIGPRPSDAVRRESGLDRAAFLAARWSLGEKGLLVAMPGDLLARAP
ncbi:MAG: DNA-processing protein DprA [Planctomycetota bacterium]